MNTLQIVRAARQAVSEVRKVPDLTSGQQDLVDSAYLTLVDLEDTLVLEDIKSSVKALQDGADELRDLTGRMKKSIAKIKKIADTVDKAATAVGALANIVSTAMSAGIL
jgi:hypothetical protein